MKLFYLRIKTEVNGKIFEEISDVWGNNFKEAKEIYMKYIAPKNAKDIEITERFKTKKTYYIYAEEIIDFSSCEFSCEAESEEEALDIFIKENRDGWTDDDRWRLFASENPNAVEDHYKWKRECEDYEIVGSRPIEL